MLRTVRSYTQEYKSTIVGLFNSGKTYAELSDEYGVPKTTIRQWVNKDNNTDNDNMPSEKDVNIKVMQKRMAKLEQENEILYQRLAEPKSPLHIPNNKIEEIHKFIDDYKGY